MYMSIKEIAPVTIGDTREILRNRLIDAAIKFDEVSDLPGRDQETAEEIPENIDIFNDRFLEVVFLGDARAKTFRHGEDEAVEDLWVPEVRHSIRHIHGSGSGGLCTNPRVREGTYNDMMEHVAYADGTQLDAADAIGSMYAAKVATEEVVFIPRASRV